MATLEIRNVHKSYGPTKIIQDVSLSVPDGAFVVLVGPSGCGKSTLLRMIAGLEDIEDGTISIGSRVINEVEPKHRDIAMVFQNYALYPHMTVAENMGFSLRLAGQAKSEINERITEAARILGLTDYLERYPKQLSGGQRQRVAMGRAIVRDPQVFLFDEPLSNLDAKLRVQMRAELMELHERLKTTMVYVTHDQVEAMTMADIIVVMRGGVVEQIGDPLTLYDHPDNVFVASFIGSPAMNMIEGVVNGNTMETADGTVWPIPAAAAQANGKAVIYGIRPEHFVLAEAGQGIETKIRLFEPTGSETYIAAMVGGQQIGVLLRHRLKASVGDAIWLGINPEQAHLFDIKTNQRIVFD
jgi:multiple sugar transport system ATP-binding protein